ncbi:MAG: autotransporter-associated beta strand repeat-containing protein [Verrucomicrobia bacterium]|nr:autotransporter-associated beta strand repeat-containing protein [Verrucomicrobiota bacterium]
MGAAANLAGQTLTLAGNGATTITGVIADGNLFANNLTVTNTGTTTLTNTNTYTGLTTMNGAAGILILQGSNASAGATTLTAGTIRLDNASNGGLASGLLTLNGGTLQALTATRDITNPVTIAASSTVSGPQSITLSGGLVEATGGNANRTLTNNLDAGQLLTISGTVNVGATGTTAARTFGVAGTGDTSITGAMVNNTAFAHVLSKTGTGTLTLSNTLNAYTGGTVINSGTLRTGASNVIPNTGTVTVNATTAGTALFDLNGNSETIAALTLGGTGGLATSVNQVTTGAGTLTLGGTVTVSSTGNFTTPALIIGNLGLGAARTFTIGDSTGTVVDLDVQAIISGAFAITKNGQGTLQLSGTNTFNGSTTVTDGQLFLDYTTNNTSKIAAAAGLVLGGATTELNPTVIFNGNATAPTTQAFTTLTVNAGSNNIGVVSNGGQAANVNFTTITRATGGTVDFSLPAVGNITTTQPLVNGILGGYATLNNGTAFASKDGSNNLVAVTSAVKDDVTTWLATDNVVDSAGFTNSLLDCTTVNSITFSAAAPSVVTSIGRFGINSGGILVTSSSTAPSITGGTLVSGTGDIIVNAYSAADFTISSAIRGATSVTKAGPGALVLAGSNTSTGAITITEGLVKVSGGNGIGDAAAVSLKNVAASGLQLLSNETVGSIAGGGTLGGNIALGTSTLTINTNTAGTFAGVFTGSAGSAIVRNGTSGGGNLTLTGASGSGFTGTVTLNGGLTFLDGLGSMDASSITVNKGASFLISNNGGTRSSTRLLDTASIILNSADGAWSGETRPSGLAVRTDQNATTSETIGVLSFASGASYFRGDASGTTGVAGILTSNFTRSNSATLDARGRALGGSTGDRNQLRIVDATNQTNFINALVGGAGAAGTKNVSIVPWAFGESTAGTLADANMGNSLVTYVSGTGIRPLDLLTEYNTFGGTPAVTDNIRESLAADLTGIGGNTINALVVNNSNTATGTVNVTGTGAGQTLAVTSGTMLFTATAATTGTPAMGITLGGFDSGITVGSTNEYVVFVQNPTSAAAGGVVTATISSPLTSTADITKSGRGALVLSGTNTAGGGTKKTTINEGILEISSLTNIGGSTGSLVFAGGTLRLGSTLTDDISLRTVTYLQGGGTIDTNGINLTLANSAGSGVGGLTKTGAGNLTLNAASTYSGGTTVLNGTLTTGVANAFPATSSLTVNGAGAAVNLGTANQTLGVVTLTAGAINGTATLTSSDLQLGGGTIASTVILAGTTGLTKTTAGVVTLAGANTFTGQTLLTNGEISFNSIANADGTASALGAPTTATAGTIQMGLGANATALTYTGSGHTTNRTIDLVGATGSSTINANGTGALVLNGAITSEEYGAKSIVLSGTSAGAIINKVTVPITECFGVLTLQKAGSNTWQLDATNTYTGATQLDDGKLTIAAVQNLTGGLTLGSTNAVTTAGTLDITANTTFGGPMVVQTNSASNTNHLNIAAGSTLTVNNNVTIGSNAGNSTTLLDSSGGGTFNVTNPAANGIFAVGGNSATGNQTIADLSGLGSVAIALDPTTGIVRVNPNNATNIAAKDSTLILPSTGAGTTTITANILAVGDGGQNASATQLNKVKLGSGLNTLNVNTVNIGTGTRDIGEVSFNGPTGSVVLRAADGVSRVAFNMGTGAATTGVTGALGNNFDVTGHSAYLLLGAVNIGTQNRNSDLLNTFAFNQGTLDMTSLNASSKGANGNTTTTNINLGGGTVTSGAWTLASNTGPGTAVANANITGGVVTLSGNISRGVNTGAGTATATVTLAGGTLNMGGNSIGSLTAPVAFVAQSGSVSGLAELNGGGALTKTTTGTLIMRAGNNYTGATNVSDGTLQVGVGGVGTTGTGLVTAVKTGASYTNAPIISGSGSINGAVVIGDTVTAGNRGILAPGDGNTTTSNATLTITAAGGLTIAAGSQTQLGITAASGTDVAFALSGLSASAYLASLGSTSDASLTTPAAWANQPTSGQADFIKINNGAGALVLGTNGGGAAATQGIVSIFSNGLNTGSLAAGQIFNLVDWFGTFSGGFNLGSGLTQGGIYGDFDLPDISMTSFNWDTSAFKSHGVIAVVGVVPEPSRAMLMLLGLLALGFRRRRIQD